MRLKDSKILSDYTLDRKIKERGKIQSSVLLNQQTAEIFLEISAKRTTKTYGVIQWIVLFHRYYITIDIEIIHCSLDKQYKSH